VPHAAPRHRLATEMPESPSAAQPPLMSRSRIREAGSGRRSMGAATVAGVRPRFGTAGCRSHGTSTGSKPPRSATAGRPLATSHAVSPGAGVRAPGSGTRRRSDCVRNVDRSPWFVENRLVRARRSR
jgi:hypothetical protein